MSKFDPTLTRLRLQWRDDLADGRTSLAFSEYAQTTELRQPYDKAFQTRFTDGEEVITNADGYIELAADRDHGERIVNKFLGVCLALFFASMLLAAIIGNDSDVDRVWSLVGLK